MAINRRAFFIGASALAGALAASSIPLIAAPAAFKIGDRVRLIGEAFENWKGVIPDLVLGEVIKDTRLKSPRPGLLRVLWHTPLTNPRIRHLQRSWERPIDLQASDHLIVGDRVCFNDAYMQPPRHYKEGHHRFRGTVLGINALSEVPGVRWRIQWDAGTWTMRHLKNQSTEGAEDLMRIV